MKLRQHAPAALQQLLHMRVWFEIRRQRAQRRAQPGEGGEGEACWLLPPPHSFLTYCLHQHFQSTNDESLVQHDQATIGAVNKTYNEVGCCTVQQLLFLITAFRSAASISLRSYPPTLSSTHCHSKPEMLFLAPTVLPDCLCFLGSPQ